MTNKEKYIKLCKNDKTISIFSQYWWLDSVCGELNWDVIIVEKGGNIFAAMPYILKKRFFLSIINMPKLTQTLDIYFNYPKNQKYYKKLSFEKEMIDEILKELPEYDMYQQSFNYNTTNLLPYYWKGFDIDVAYTYVIDNIKIEELEMNFETDIRRRKRKAKEIGVEVFESDDIEKFYQLNVKTFKRQNRVIPYTFEFIKKLYNKCKENNACKIYFAKDKDKKIIAGNFLLYDEQTVYYLMGGIDPYKKDLGGMDLVQFESIKFALESNRKFDFEGSMIQSIEKYFRSFGALQKPYYKISKINSKLLKIRNFIKDI